MTFFDIYREELARAVAEHPDEYPWAAPGINNSTIIQSNTGPVAHPLPSTAQVAEKMIDAVKRKTFNKDGRAFKATCKRLGIAHTYKAIYAYLDTEKQ